MTDKPDATKLIGVAIAYLISLCAFIIVMLAAAVIIQALWRVMFP